MEVLVFAIKLTFIGFFPIFSDKYCLKDVIKISLRIIIRLGTINEGRLKVERRYTKGIIIRSLSAVKSNKAPSDEVVLVFLAIYPSR